MLNRDQMVNLIVEAYANRARGDKAAVDKVWAEGATYKLVGDESLMKGFPGGGAQTALREIIDLITFEDHRLIDAVVDGHKAAVRLTATCRVRDEEPFEIELYDLWTFNDEGKATSLTQFTDTALLASRL